MKLDADRLMMILHHTIRSGLRAKTPDLSARQLAMLLIVGEEPEMHTVRGLALRLAISKPAISRSLNRLCSLRLAGRMPDPRDGRSVLVVATASGIAHLTDLRTQLTASVDATAGRHSRRKTSLSVNLRSLCGPA